MSQALRLMAFPLLLVVIVSSAACAPKLKPPQQIDRSPYVSYDHSRCPAGAGPATTVACEAEGKMTLRDGEVFGIRIQKTFPNQFEYVVAGVKVPAAEEDTLLQRGAARKDTVLWQIHDKQFGGYIVRIRKAPGRTRASLGEALIRIAVETAEWKIGFGSGFAGTGLTDPFFALRDTTVVVADDQAESGERSEVRQKLVEQVDREDEVDLDLTAMTHVWHSKLPWLGATFGMGLKDGTRARYYLGPSIRMGDKAAFTAGMVIGSIEAPPPGIELDDLVNDANALKNLSHRNVKKAFIGISYTFIGGADKALAKPFAGAGGGAAVAAAPADPEDDPTPAEEDDPPPELVLLDGAAIVEGGELPIDMRVGDTRTITVRAVRERQPVPDATIHWSVAGASGELVSGAKSTEADGSATAEIKAVQQGTFEVIASTSQNPTEAQTVSVKVNVTVEEEGGG